MEATTVTRKNNQLCTSYLLLLLQLIDKKIRQFVLEYLEIQCLKKMYRSMFEKDRKINKTYLHQELIKIHNNKTLPLPLSQNTYGVKVVIVCVRP
jgi:hypothetical protein